MRTIDLFAGCGGLSLGFQNAGFEIIAAFDKWAPACNVYQQNFDHPIFACDIANTDTKVFADFKPEIIIGGAPCQDFSVAGKRNYNGDKADLSVKFAEIIATIRPSWCVMENVENYHKTAKYEQVRAMLKKAGYGLTEVVLNACYCGAPQSRERYFCIGELNGKDNALLSIINKVAPPMTVRDYLKSNDISLDLNYYYRHPRSYKRKAIYSLDELSPAIRGTNRPIQGYAGHPQDAAPLTSDVRPLTSIERSYIQTFPQSYDWSNVGKTDLEQMIGNAVPVKLAEFVGNSIQKYIASQAPVNVQLTA